MKILVTGANGQVGHSLRSVLTQRKMEHLALTRKQLDITNSLAIEDRLKAYQPDIVINAAAYTAVDKAESDSESAFQINRDGAANLARACAKTGAAIFHISTDYVFSGSHHQAYCEDDLTAPQCIYGQSKLDGERVVASSCPKHIILRTAWVFGEHGNNFVKTMLRLGREREQLSIVADQLGGPTYAGDIAATLADIANVYAETKNLDWGTYHFSGLPYCSWYEFAHCIFEHADQQSIYTKSAPKLSAITTADYPTPAKRPSNSRLNCSKIQQTFAIQPSDWHQALNNLTPYLS